MECLNVVDFELDKNFQDQSLLFLNRKYAKQKMLNDTLMETDYCEIKSIKISQFFAKKTEGDFSLS